VSEGGARVALTFDAEHPDRSQCPPGGAERILDVLRDANARATFFLQGRWARSHPEAAHRIADEGHLVGHHSHYHVRMPLLTDDGIAQDVREGEEAIRQSSGVDPHPWFRCPFGAGADDPRVLGVLEELGYRNVGWHVELEDWEPWRTAPDISSEGVEAALAHGDGAIVLLHTWPAATREAVPEIVGGLVGAGARLVGVDELEGLP
jgi:peptidoglycan/xylan/chitin deacetylase (PgdA/CDA1 family)